MIAELRQKRASLIAEVRKIQGAAAGGVLSADDLAKCDKIEADISNIEKNIDLQERQSKREAELATSSNNRVGGSENSEERAKKEKADAEVRNLIRYLATGERRDLAADTASAGGNVVLPQIFANQVLKKLDDYVFIRGLATKYTLGAASTLGVPSISADPADPDWTTEVQAVTADTTLAFGKRALTPSILSKLIKVSMKMLEVTDTIDPVGLVADRLGYKFSIAQEKAFISGTGSGQPLGLFTASANGISTGRDVAGSNTTTAIVADSLFDVQASVKAQYRANAKWLFHRDAIKQIRKLKTTTNDYLFQPGLLAGQPDMLLGKPILESEYVPNTFTTGLYVGLFGDFSKYWIVDQLGMSIQRLNELYAATNQVGFIGRMSTDGAPVDELAFARVKLG